MMRTHQTTVGQTPLGAVARGLIAGAVGTSAMTAYQLLVARLRKDDSETQPKRWRDAPAPAQVGKRILTGVFKENVTLADAGKLTQAMHWAYGTGWGAALGLLQGTIAASPVPAGAAFGAGVWGMSYAQLVPMGIYEAPWKYPAKELALDLSYHVVYGVAAAATLDRISPAR